MRAREQEPSCCEGNSFRTLKTNSGQQTADHEASYICTHMYGNGAPGEWDDAKINEFDLYVGKSIRGLICVCHLETARSWRLFTKLGDVAFILLILFFLQQGTSDSPSGSSERLRFEVQQPHLPGTVQNQGAIVMTPVDRMKSVPDPTKTDRNLLGIGPLSSDYPKGFP